MKKTLTLTLLFLLLAVAIGLVAAQKQEGKNTTLQQPQPSPKLQDKDLTADEIAKLNSTPQKQYPEFTLEAQKQAMRFVEEMRRKKRVEGLREKIPPADWIEIAYHGLVVDANFDPIEMNFKTVSKMQESMFSILYQPDRMQQELKQYGRDLKTLFYEQKLQPQDQLVVRTTVLSALLAQSDAKLQARYVWRYRLLRDAANTVIDPLTVISPEAAAIMRPFDPDKFLPNAGSQYVEDCRTQGVPIPPDWPDERWISQGPLEYVFISAGLTAEVFAYKDPDVSGVCYALPRRYGSSIELLGIICQSNTTGKACFWDNKTSAGRVLYGSAVRLDIQRVANGSNLSAPCTYCHRGYNVFNIHPGSALDLSRVCEDGKECPGTGVCSDGRGCSVGGPYETNPNVRYTPMAQPHWTNPGPLVLSPRDRQCLGCHELPQTTDPTGRNYCNEILQNAAMLTMPPFGKARAGWPDSSVAINPAYAGHIEQLSRCP